jgi:hypothetical protein
VARALALPVRVVASDELNEIDLAAGAAPAWQAPLAFAAEPAVETIGAGGARGMERRAAEAVSPAAPTAPNPATDHPSETASTPAIDNWAMRLWAIMQNAVSVVSSSLNRLVP